MGFYAGLRAVCAVAEGLTEFCGEMPYFEWLCHTFDHFLENFSRDGGVVHHALGGSKFFGAAEK